MVWINSDCTESPQGYQLSILPFQDHLPSIPLSNWIALSQETTATTILSLTPVLPVSGILFQEHLQSITLPTWWALSPRTPEQSLFASVTNESISQDHLLGRILLTWRSLFPRRPEQWICKVSSPVSPKSCHFKTMFQVELCNRSKSSGLGDLKKLPFSLSPQWPAISSVTNAWPFQDHLPSRTLLTQTALCPRRPD